MSIILICGLGNPGKQYQKNRHNIGFLAVDYIAAEMGISFSDSAKFSGAIAIKKEPTVTYILFKPYTFMNLSGQAVTAVKKFYNIDLDHIWVIHDEIDLPFGELRSKKGGGHAGHNGLRSLDAHIGKDYHRMRVGVDRPLHKEDVANYVLSDFAKSEDYQSVIEMMWKTLREEVVKEGGF